tara:strand:- start:320 stop:544 length:225 start_codon:yes stop_codon:yes gene_type:complete
MAAILYLVLLHLQVVVAVVVIVLRQMHRVVLVVLVAVVQMVRLVVLEQQDKVILAVQAVLMPHIWALVVAVLVQ